MRRTFEQAIDALRAQVQAWATGAATPDLRVLVYPPEWEPLMLVRMPVFADSCAADGEPVEIVDLGQGFLRALRERNGAVERLQALDREEVLHDLGWIGTTYLRQVIRSPLTAPSVCRLLINAGALGAFVSYSAVANELAGSPSDGGISATALAFPGEADDRSLNLLRLRIDTNYRVARI
jgi:hypothetical protein